MERNRPENVQRRMGVRDPHMRGLARLIALRGGIDTLEYLPEPRILMIWFVQKIPSSDVSSLTPTSRSELVYGYTIAVSLLYPVPYRLVLKLPS